MLRKVSCWRLIIFLWRAFILFLQPAFAAAIFVSIFFSVKGASRRDTCQTNLIEERFEGFSTVRYSYLAESTGTRPLPEMLAFFFAFLKDLALEFAFSHFSGICTKNRIFRQLSQLMILFFMWIHMLWLA